MIEPAGGAGQGCTTRTISYHIQGASARMRATMDRQFADQVA